MAACGVLVLPGALAACSGSAGTVDGLGYVVGGAIPTYNVSSTTGAESAARQAFVRVQTGFSYPGPHGETVEDTDFGRVAAVPGDPAAVAYEINPAATYSDGAPVVCDDLVLAWAAQSGRFTVQGPSGEPVSIFDAPVDPVLAQIIDIDCDPGSRKAVVHYEGDRAVRGWKSAFGATTMLPAHVVAAGTAARAGAGHDHGTGEAGESEEPGAAGGADEASESEGDVQSGRSTEAGERDSADESDTGGEKGETGDSGGAGGAAWIVDAAATGDVEGLKPAAEYWNTAFTLSPGTVDPSVFVSSGPYRLDRVQEDGSVVLVANDQWWGDPPLTDTIVVYPSSVSIPRLAQRSNLAVVDGNAGTVDTATLTSGYSTGEVGSTDVEQIVLGMHGDLADPDVRRAVAACIPRAELAAAVGGDENSVTNDTDGAEAAGGADGADGVGGATPAEDGTADSGEDGGDGSEADSAVGGRREPGPVVLGSRSTLPGVLDYDFVASTSGGAWMDSDTDAARGFLASAGLDGLTVRVGYRAPDVRRSRAVEMIAHACGAAGIDVVDASAADFTGEDLADGRVDAVLGGTGGSQVGPPRGPAAPVARLAALSTGSSTNIGGYSNERIDQIVAQLRRTPPGADAINLTHEAEAILWEEMPTVPLYAVPRTVRISSGLSGAEPVQSWAGAGWNMDRWSMRR